MRKRDLISKLEKVAASGGERLVFIREGQAHEIWKVGSTVVQIPRHKEVNKYVANRILRQIEERNQR